MNIPTLIKRGQSWRIIVPYYRKIYLNTSDASRKSEQQAELNLFELKIGQAQ